MTEHYFHFDQLSPAEALRVLAQTAEQTGGEAMEMIQVRAERSAYFGATVTLLAPDAHAARGEKAALQARRRTLDLLADVYTEVKARQPKRGQVDARARGLAQSAAWLLVNAEGDQAAGAHEKEYLLLARHLDAARAAEVVENLRFHAIQTRVAVAERRGQAANGVVYLFHVLDDAERRSGFRGALAGQLFIGCALLRSFADEQLTVFLPDAQSPSKEGLRWFCRLLRQAPTLFSDGAPAPSSGFLAAIDQVSNGDGNGRAAAYELFYLAGLTFFSQVELTPPLDQDIDVTLHDLADSATRLKDLRGAIDKADPFVGYRMELRPTPYRGYHQHDYEQLYRQYNDIEHRLAYLLSLRHPRPTLYRFTQAQLPALADLIRSHPIRFLQSGVFEYGFQADDQHPAGVHYLLVSPQAVRDELNPLPLYAHLDRMQMHFWLDPFWAPYYHGQGPQSLVFVPYGAALFPTMHGWTAADMDAYLREVMARWFYGRIGADELPARPLYLFDGDVLSDASIQISVLNRESFRPLHTQLGWLNDNLSVLNAVGVEPLIQAMADDIARRDLGARFAQEAATAVAAFTETAQTTRDQIAGATAELTAAVTVELDQLVQETAATIEAIQAFNTRLDDLRALYTSLRRQTERAEHLAGCTAGRTEEVTAFTHQLRKRVEAALADARATRQAVQIQVTGEVEHLQQAQRDLQRILDELQV